MTDAYEDIARSIRDNAVHDEITVTISRGSYSFDGGKTWFVGDSREAITRYIDYIDGELAKYKAREVGKDPLTRERVKNAALGTGYGLRPPPPPRGYIPAPHGEGFVRADNPPQPKGPPDPPEDDRYCPGADDPIRGGLLS